MALRHVSREQLVKPQHGQRQQWSAWPLLPALTVQQAAGARLDLLWKLAHFVRGRITLQ